MAEMAPTAPAGDRQVPLADLLANNTETREDEPGDTAGLLKLLLVANDIAAPDHHPVMPAATSDDNITAETPTRTATEMLTGAIEILKSLEAGALPCHREELGPDCDTAGSRMVLQADPDFIGPMPVVAVTAETICIGSGYAGRSRFCRFEGGGAIISRAPHAGHCTTG